MYSDNKIIIQLIALLKANQINKIVISPGSRHYPFIHSLETDDFFKLFSVVDERSASFFALGLIQQYNEPVAICCTSGSATLNYGSAVSEAFYQHLPLLLITVDRFPELLGQKEDQFIKQDGVFKDFLKKYVQLKDIKTELDEWYDNRLINEALIELYQHGTGPVQINFPILEHHTDTYQTRTLPEVRKITWHTPDIEKEEWESNACQLKDKQILIIWGQSVLLTKKLKKGLDAFCKTFNCVILTDKISNLHHEYAIENSFSVFRALSIEEAKDLAPDITITIGANILFNGEIKGYLNQNCSQLKSWQVGTETKVCDPYRSLTDVFEMNESTFFEKLAEYNINSTDNYFEKWHNIASSIQTPTPPYSELYAIGKLIESIPNKSVIHLSNSLTVRMGNLFKFDNSIKCYCNRGVNGIDGCMSTAVGYTATTDENVFLIIGDLTFFYDMNALWNRHLSKNLRILLLNNEGGGVMHMPFTREASKSFPNYVSAGHQTTAKGWIESLGIEYYSASNEKEVENGVIKLIDGTTEAPVVLEVFTKKEDDVQIIKQYFSSISRITLVEKAKRKVDRIVSKYIKH